MSKINVEAHENVAVIRLTNGVTNAIGPDMVSDLSTAMDCIQPEFQGMVLAGGEKFFSIGFDLPQLLELDRSDMTEFYDAFNRMVLALYTLPVPTAFAMAGHAIAGGTILALTCDYRYSVVGRKLFGLNEIKLGLPVPYLTDLMLRQLVSERSATEILYKGALMKASDAEGIGLFDGILSTEEVETKALETVTQLTDLPQKAFGAIKVNRVDGVRLQYEKNHKSKNDVFLDCWFEEKTQKLLMEAAEKF
jgi:enoyl-CoA hydratase/carnithine racemase